MKIAIDIYNGYEQEVSAAEIEKNYGIGKSPPDRRNRFFCTECAMDAQYRIRSRADAHFAHNKRRNEHENCSLRVDGTWTYHVYKRVGFPIYLIKDEKSGEYSLNIAFPPWNSSKHITITISADYRKKEIRTDNFRYDGINLITVDFYPKKSSKDYKIEYSQQLNNWADYSGGFGTLGAIFKIQGNGAKKIRYGDSISLDPKNEYLLVSDSVSLYSKKKFLSYETESSILLNGNEHYIYRFSFNEQATQYIEEINEFFRQNFQIIPVRKKAETVPIWPPIVERADWYYPYGIKSMFYCFDDTEAENPKLLYYDGNNAPYNLITPDKTAKIGGLGDNDLQIFLGADRQYTGREVALRRGTFKPTINQVISINGINVFSINSINQSSLENGIEINTNAKILVIFCYENNRHEIHKIEQEKTFLEYSPDIEKIIFAYTEDREPYSWKHIACSLPFKTLEVICRKKTTNEAEIINCLKQKSFGQLVPVPYWVYGKISWLFRNNMLLAAETVKTTVAKGRIYINMLEYLRHLGKK